MDGRDDDRERRLVLVRLVLDLVETAFLFVFLLRLLCVLLVLFLRVLLCFLFVLVGVDRERE